MLVICSERKNPPAKSARKMTACGVVGRKNEYENRNKLLTIVLTISTRRKPKARMIGLTNSLLLIAPAALAKVMRPEDKASRPNPTCSINGIRNGKAPSPMRKMKPPIVVTA